VALITAWLGPSMPDQAFSPLVAGREAKGPSPDGNRFNPASARVAAYRLSIAVPAVEGGRSSLLESQSNKFTPFRFRLPGNAFAYRDLGTRRL